MSRYCDITGKSVISGNNVSHANNKTRRKFIPNIHNVSFISEYIGKISLRSTKAGLRVVEKYGGIDMYLLKTPQHKLTYKTNKISKKIKKYCSKSIKN